MKLRIRMAILATSHLTKISEGLHYSRRLAMAWVKVSVDCSMFGFFSTFEFAEIALPGAGSHSIKASSGLPKGCWLLGSECKHLASFAYHFLLGKYR